jgi:hypothetical protein
MNVMNGWLVGWLAQLSFLVKKIKENRLLSAVVIHVSR